MAEDDHDTPIGKLTPLQRRRLNSSIRINDTPADRIAYQHTVPMPNVPSMRAMRVALRRSSGVGLAASSCGARGTFDAAIVGEEVGGDRRVIEFPEKGELGCTGSRLA